MSRNSFYGAIMSFFILHQKAKIVIHRTKRLIARRNLVLILHPIYSKYFVLKFFGGVLQVESIDNSLINQI